MRQNQKLNFKLNTSKIIFILLTISFTTSAFSVGKILIRAGMKEVFISSNQILFMKAGFLTLGSATIVESRCFAYSSKSYSQKKEQNLLWYWEKSICLNFDFPGSDGLRTHH
jgi:hypothetical protein